MGLLGVSAGLAGLGFGDFRRFRDLPALRFGTRILFLGDFTVKEHVEELSVCRSWGSGLRLSHQGPALCVAELA